MWSAERLTALTCHFHQNWLYCKHSGATAANATTTARNGFTFNAERQQTKLKIYTLAESNQKVKTLSAIKNRQFSEDFRSTTTNEKNAKENSFRVTVVRQRRTKLEYRKFGESWESPGPYCAQKWSVLSRLSPNFDKRKCYSTTRYHS